MCNSAYCICKAFVLGGCLTLLFRVQIVVRLNRSSSPYRISQKSKMVRNAGAFHTRQNEHKFSFVRLKMKMWKCTPAFSSSLITLCLSDVFAGVLSENHENHVNFKLYVANIASAYISHGYGWSVWASKTETPKLFSFCSRKWSESVVIFFRKPVWMCGESEQFCYCARW